MLNKLRRHFHPILHQESGGVVILMALASVMLILAVGVAVDMARAQILRTRIQSALDAAGLGAGTTANRPPENMTRAAWVQSQAQKYFDANFPTGYLASTSVTVATSSPDNYTTINLSADSVQSTVFMSSFGVPTVSVDTASQVSRTGIANGMELVLVLDNTGSMNCDVSDQNPALPCPVTSTSKISVLKQAVADLLNILYGSTNDTAPNLWVGVVPLSQTVNIGINHLSWMDPADPSLGYDWGNGQSASTGWAGCVMARPVSGTYGYSGGYAGENDSDDPPGGPTTITNEGPPWNQTTFERYYFPSTVNNTPLNGGTGTGMCNGPVFSNDLLGFNPWMCTTGGASPTTAYQAPLDATHFGPNLYCPQPITPMTASKATVLAAINSMVATGDTDLDQGLAWGWRMISPRWRGLWGGEMNATGNPTYPQLPFNYNEPHMLKIIILMTDGQPHFSPGYFTGTNNPVNNQPIYARGNFTAYGSLDNAILNNDSSQIAFFSNMAYVLGTWYCQATNGYGSNCASGTVAQVMEGLAEVGLADSFVGNTCSAIHAANNSGVLTPGSRSGNNNVVFYEIGYGPNGTTLESVNGSLMNWCTAYLPGQYFNAPTNAALTSVFQQIGNQLTNLRISK